MATSLTFECIKEVGFNKSEWSVYDKSGRHQSILEAARPHGVIDPYVVLYDGVVEWCRAHPELIGRGNEKPTANDASRTSIADVFE